MHTEEKKEYDATGGKEYLRVCESLGIIPASYFLRVIQAQESTVSMSHHGIGPKGAKAIAIALTVRSYTSTLIGTCSRNKRSRITSDEKLDESLTLRLVYMYLPVGSPFHN